MHSLGKTYQNVVVLVRAGRALDVSAIFYLGRVCSYKVRRAVEDGAGWKVRKEIREIVMSTISKRMQKCSDIEAYYRNVSKTF